MTGEVLRVNRRRALAGLGSVSLGALLADKNYLRGAQVTNSAGIVEFLTIYPGWYQGRTVHIHAKVHLDKQTVLTTQFFFDEKTQRAVSRSAPYSVGDTDNASDEIFNEALVLATRPEGDGYLGTISVDVGRA